MLAKLKQKPMKRTLKKSTKSYKRYNNKKSKKLTLPRWSFMVLVVLGVVASAVLISTLLFKSSPLAFSNITGKNTDRIAPKIDTISGHYSVSGEAASTSLLVKYKSTVTENTRSSINSKMGAKPRQRVSKLGVDEVQLVSTQSVGEIINKYKSFPEVEYVEPNYVAKQFITPNDPLFSKQWALQKINALAAWDTSMGGFGPVAIIDTGISSAQIDINGSVLDGYNFVSKNTNANDDNGHGTHVAGIVSASTNNGTGVASIGFKGTLLPVKVLDSTGAGTYADISSGVIYATDRGAKIVNLSLGGPSYSRTLGDAIAYATNHGVVVVAAAGNNGNNSAVYPADYPGVIAVSATNQNDGLAPFSSYGSHVYVSAPGVSIISTYNSGGYATLSGTSMAAPMVSGLIGLALSRGAASASTVVNDLKITSDKIGPFAYDQNGWNQYFGYGRINAAKLLGVTAINAVPTTLQTSSSTSDATNVRSSKSPQYADTSFSTTITGTIDSIDLEHLVIVTKVVSSSKNLKLRDGNLIDLYVQNIVTVKNNNRILTISELKIGDKLNIKAQWKDNKLSAQEIQVLGR